MDLKRFRKDEDGAIAVLAALIMVVLLGFAALTVDMGLKYMQESKIQTACDSAALAAATYLPDTSEADIQARQYLDKNGFDGSTAEVTFPEDGKVKVVLKQSVKTVFANVLGIDELKTKKSAVASAGAGAGKKANFDYAIFQGGEGDLSVGNGTWNIYGKVHSNGSISTQNTITCMGMTAVDGMTVSNNPRIAIKKEDGSYEIVQMLNHETWWSPEAGNVYINDIYGTDSNGNKVSYGTYVYKEDEKIDMPMYLADNMNALIPTNIPMVGDFDGWVTINSRTELKEYYTDATKYTGKNVKYTGTGGDSGGIGMYAAATTSIYIDSVGTNFDYNIASTSGTMSGNIYAKVGTGKQFSLTAYGSTLTINGNVYVDGDLKIRGSININGNIYCTGKISNEGDGSQAYIKATYVYADSIDIQSGFNVSGVVVAENDIKFYGQTTTVGGSAADSLSVYSRTGNIDFSPGSAEFHGIVFAPYGKISTGSSYTVYGSMIADSFNITSGLLTVYPLDVDLGYGVEDPNLPALSSGKVKLTD